MFKEKAATGLKLILRFGVLWVVALGVQDYLVMGIECVIHVWESYPKLCLRLVLGVAIVCTDFIDGAIFGRSVIDTIFDKLKSVASVKDETPPTSGAVQ